MNLGSKSPKQPKMPCKTRKDTTRPPLASSQGLASNLAENDYEFGENAKRTNGSIFTRPHYISKHLESVILVAQCSATPAIVAATPPCSATPFQTTKFRCDTSRHRGGEGATPNIFRGCSATPVLHLQNAIKSRKSAATRVARHV